MHLTLGGKTIDEVAMDRLRQYETLEGHYLAFSGGKDSVVIYDLAMRSGVRFDAHYNVSPIDPTELRQFIKEYYPDVVWDNYCRNFWGLVSHKGPPLRHKRWCCEKIKEAGGSGRLVVTGVRWEESRSRKARRMVETSYLDKTKSFLHPIIDWSEMDVWQYIGERSLPYCSLYDEDFGRLGCVMCPFVRGKRLQAEMERWPKIARNWHDAVCRWFQKRLDEGKPCIQNTPEEYWEWWISRR